eukprot:1317417-Prymnesium_polylepis.2
MARASPGRRDGPDYESCATLLSRTEHPSHTPLAVAYQPSGPGGRLPTVRQLYPSRLRVQAKT